MLSDDASKSSFRKAQFHMSVHGFKEYLERMKASWQAKRLDSLQVQQKFVGALRIRHQTWAKDVNDQEIARAHVEIAGLLQEVTHRYEQILKMYSQDGK